MQTTRDLAVDLSGRPADQPRSPRKCVMILSNVRLVREGLSRSLRGRDDLIVLSEVDPRSSNSAAAEGAQPDVVVIDTHGVDIIALSASTRQAWPDAKLVAFAVAEQGTDVLACAEAGFSSYVPREGGTNELYQAIIDAVNGRVHCAPHIAAAMFFRLAEFGQSRAAATVPSILTARECEIIALSNGGCSNKEVARRLAISGATVKNHMHNIFQKLRVNGRGEAAAVMRTESYRRAP
jgi:two-component system, NarL family, nitrate/nitrite response regulator NarL